MIYGKDFLPLSYFNKKSTKKNSWCITDDFRLKILLLGLNVILEKSQLGIPLTKQNIR